MYWLRVIRFVLSGSACLCPLPTVRRNRRGFTKSTSATKLTSKLFKPHAPKLVPSASNLIPLAPASDSGYVQLLSPQGTSCSYGSLQPGSDGAIYVAATLTIRILLDETRPGDGNDFVLDDVGLFLMKEVR